MGGTNFTHVVAGKTADDAFRKAQQDAEYDYGHSGYTGTVAEKPGFRLIEGPVKCRAKSDDLVNWIAESECNENAPAIPKQHRLWASKHVKQYTDKWGAALAIELTGKEKAEWKKLNNLKGTQARVFVFFGVASC